MQTESTTQSQTANTAAPAKATKIAFLPTTRNHFYSGCYAWLDKTLVTIHKNKIGNVIAKGSRASFSVFIYPNANSSNELITLGTEVKTLAEAKKLCAEYVAKNETQQVAQTVTEIKPANSLIIADYLTEQSFNELVKNNEQIKLFAQAIETTARLSNGAKYDSDMQFDIIRSHPKIWNLFVSFVSKINFQTNS